MQILRYLTFFFLLSLSFKGLAAVNDSIAPPDSVENFDSLNVRHLEFNSLKYDFIPRSQAVGNSLKDFQLYDPTIFSGLQYFGLGNVGSSYHLGRLGEPGYSGFKYWIWHTRSAYLFSTENLGFYNSEKAYSRVDYAGGSKKENVASAILARNFGKYLNVGLQFSRINSEGFYVRQLNSYSNIGGFAKLYSRNQKYLLLVNGALNGNTNQESGGLEQDTLFEINASNNRKLLPVNLQSAQTRLRQRNAFVYQS